MSLPIMDAPVPSEFVSTDRIQQIYAELPSTFAKEILRRQQMGVPTGPSVVPPLSSSPSFNQNLKRDRPEDSGMDHASKRRDTGESKPSSMMMPPAVPSPAPSSLVHPSINQFSVPMSNGVGQSSMSMHQHPPQMSSPSISQPPLNPAMMNTTEGAARSVSPGA